MRFRRNRDKGQKSVDAQRTDLFIDGQWRKGGKTFDSINPADGQTIGAVSISSSADINDAVAAAQRALPAWRASGASHRSAIVGRAAAILAEWYGGQSAPAPLKSLITSEVGKRFPEADIEVIESSDMLRYFAEAGPGILEPRRLHLDQELWPSKAGSVVFEPVGVTAVIKAWNYPLEIPLWSIGAALVAGNTLVFKPSEHSPLVGAEIVRLFNEAGLPAGVLNFVPGDGTVGRTLAAHPDVAMVSFTGSVAVGKEIASACAQRLARYTLELGGNDAAIILPDVDLDLAANGLVWGAICNSGQVCVGVKRVFAHRDIVDELTARVVSKVKELRLGIDYGPVISGDQLATVTRQVAQTVDAGAVVLSDTRLPDHPASGFYYPPTVLGNVPPSSEIMKTECFGPVLPIVSVRSVEEGVVLANGSTYGLGASVWTSDLEAGKRIAESLEAGMVWVNDVNVAFPQAPWGGTKLSGHGTDLSEFGILEFVNHKHVSVELSTDKRRDWWYPYTTPDNQ